MIIPIALGFLITHFFGKYTSKVKDVLPLISVILIALIIASIVSHNSERIMDTGAIVFIVVILHNLLGFAAGFLLGHLLKLPLSEKKTLAIEVGMQNSGLAHPSPERRSRGLPWLRCPERSSQYGIIYPERSWRPFLFG